MSWSLLIPVVEAASVSSASIYVSDSVDLGVIAQDYVIWSFASTTDPTLQGPLNFDFQGSLDDTNWYPVPGGGIEIVSGTPVVLPDDWSGTALPVASEVPVRYLRAIGSTEQGTMTASAYYAVRESL